MIKKKINIFFLILTISFFGLAHQTKASDSYTKLLLHGDGANGSTTFTDSSGVPKTVTPYGNTQISTAQSKFGGSSMYFDSSGDYLLAPDNDDWNFNSGDFTIDFWINFSNLGSRYQSILGQFYSGGNNWIIQTDFTTSKYLNFYKDNALALSSSNLSISENSWHHFAFVRLSGNLSLYHNGSSVGSGAVGTFTDSSGFLEIGGYVGQTVFNGYLDELRISKGVARWTSNFTPPTRAYDNDFSISPSSGSSSGGTNVTITGEGFTAVGGVGSGGTITTSGGYTIHTFTSDGTFSVPTARDVEVLVVAGGGGGGAHNGGGGGAGGVISTSISSVSGSKAIVVGNGGEGSINQSAAGANGGNSSFDNSVAIGGGGGGSVFDSRGRDGGSGGGEAHQAYQTSLGLGTIGQGNNGGHNYLVSPYGTGGGGGAGQVGGTADASMSGNGGNGILSSISGVATYYGGGGGGGSNTSTPGAGGSGGGGAGGPVYQVGVDGIAGTGGGGGGTGAWSGSLKGGNGGSGVVIVRYLTQQNPSVAFGGTPATNIQFVDSEHITVTTPAHSVGSVDVVVTNPDGTTKTLANGFTYSSHFTLTYTAGANGSITGTTPQTVSQGDSGTAVTAVPNSGYHFTSWSDSSTQNPRTDTNVQDNLSVAANFAINTYTVTFQDHDSTVLKTETVNHGSNATPPADPERTGYTFTGWDSSYTNITENKTITAEYSINQYTVTFNNNTGTTEADPTTQTANYNTTLTLPTPPTKTGYTFSSWNAQSNGEGTTFNNTTPVTNNLTVYAQYTINQYTITFNGNTNTGGSTATQTLNYNTLTNLTANGYTKTGYTFSHWNTQADNNGTTYANQASYTIGTESITLYAQYTINQYTLTYTAGDNGSITGTTSQTVNYNSNGTQVTAVPNTNYHFVDWSDSSTTNPRTDTNIQSNLNITASFAIDTYTVTFQDHNSTVLKTETVNHGADATPPANPERTGYTFTGWDSGYTNITENKTITAQYSINQYTITFNGNTNTGGSTETQTINYNTPTNLTANGYTKTGYTFSHWNTQADNNGTTYANQASYTIGTESITLYAQYTINQYTLTYTAGDNGSITGTTSQTVNYNTNGTQVTANPSPNYHFTSWSDGLTTNPRTDTNIQANINVTANFVSILANQEESIPTEGGTLALSTNQGTATLTIPSNYYLLGETPQVLDFQINKLDTTNHPTPPTNKSLIQDNYFGLQALTEEDTYISEFNQPITFTLTYSQEAETLFQETTFDVYKYDNGQWIKKNCLLDTNANTLTCTLSSFSLYSILGEPIEEESPTPTPIITTQEEPQKAKILSWKATQYSVDKKSCTTNLKLIIKGKHFDKNAEVRIGNTKASSTKRISSKKIQAIFCLDKLEKVKTSTKRTVNVTNPDAKKEQAKKRIDLTKVKTTYRLTDFDTQTSQGIKNLQTVLYQKGYLNQQSITGYFGDITKEALRQFQEKNKLAVTGILDEKTKKKLGE